MSELLHDTHAWYALSFVIFVIGAIRFGKKPILEKLDRRIEEIRNELFGLAGYRDGARFFSGQGDPRIKHLMEQLENAAKQVEQLKMQVQHGLAFEKEKRAIDQRKAQVDLEGIRMQAQGQDPMAEHMLEIQKLRMEAAEAQQKLELERQEAEAELQLKRGTAEAELALERARLAAEIQLEREKLQAELTLQRQKTSAEMQIKASTAERDSETKARAAESASKQQPAKEPKPAPAPTLPDIHIHLPSGKKKVSVQKDGSYLSEEV